MNLQQRRERRIGAHTFLFGAEGHEYVLNIEVNELSRTNRKTRTAMEKNIRLGRFHQHQQFQLLVGEHQRFARHAVSQAVLDSSARFEMTLSLELRQGNFTSESAVQHCERDMSFDLVIKPQENVVSKEPMWCTSTINSLKKEKMESEQRLIFRVSKVGGQVFIFTTFMKSARRGRAMIEGRATFRKLRRRETQARCDRKNSSKPKSGVVQDQLIG